MEDLSAGYPTPEPVQGSFDTLKERIRAHYELCSDYYYSLWGVHIHHGYFLKSEDTKEVAQVQLIDLLLQKSGLPQGSDVLDVGCGIGGTSRYLAKECDCTVTGITISGQQVQIAQRLSRQSETPTSTQSVPSAGIPASAPSSSPTNGFDQINNGKVRFTELDAEKMGDVFASASFDAVWISEAMSHLPNKQLFFDNAFKLLKPGGRLVIADWFKAENLTSAQTDSDIQPIEDGMLLPPLCTQQGYVDFAKRAGLSVLAEPMDISRQVAKTWDISISLVSSPSLWALAFTQGRDFIAFLQAFKAMRRGYANGTFRYAVMAFQK